MIPQHIGRRLPQYICALPPASTVLQPLIHSKGLCITVSTRAQSCAQHTHTHTLTLGGIQACRVNTNGRHLHFIPIINSFFIKDIIYWCIQLHTLVWLLSVSARGSNGKDLFHTRRFDFCHSTGGTNIINSGSVPVKCPSKPCQWANMNNNEGQQAQLNWMQSLLLFGMQVWTHYKATGDWGKQWCTCTVLYCMNFMATFPLYQHTSLFKVSQYTFQVRSTQCNWTDGST